MLISLAEENERLRNRLEQAKARFEDRRRIPVDKAGSIAEAALVLNGVFRRQRLRRSKYLEIPSG
ncbi:MAG: hypothetical protein PUC36_06445 [Clostridiales bacterium]|nr:hypothetical protein [Clostridiales bacterium]